MERKRTLKNTRPEKRQRVENSGFGIFRNLTTVFLTSSPLLLDPFDQMLSIPSIQWYTPEEVLVNPMFLFTFFASVFLFIFPLGGLEICQSHKLLDD
ncbi:hypothetical protein F5883DRAFT_574647 [Diaporthe sp. PMI_573]|nr:hypothetical protein F5883DRAFT_574647 [Diaporthaceae sp. PMI_573]